MEPVPHSHTRQTPDPGWYFMFAMIIGTTIWLAALPFCRFEQRCLLDRYHLQTPSFALWCGQQPIPAMYNGYNRFESRQEPQEVKPHRAGTLNHFPVRMLTFGDNRPLFLSNDHPTVLDAWSSYRGLTLHTRWTAKPGDDGHQLTSEVLP